MNVLWYLVINTLAVLATAYILPGVNVAGPAQALLVAIVLGLVMTYIRPVILFLTLPVNVLTLGLFTFVVNALLILVISAIVPGFRVENFWWALTFSLVLSIVSSLLYALIPGV